MYKYETHMHTTEGSACARADARAMVNKAKENGYDGVFITNHFFNGNTAVDRNLPWADRIRAFMKGYEIGKEEGEKIGIDVFFGFEYSYLSEGTDLLTYGLGADFLMAHPHLCEMSGKSYIELVHECGGFIVHAHPFREVNYIPMVRLFFDRIDGVEVINASHTDPIFNERAHWYAQSYKLPMTSGSDAHSLDGIRGGIVVKDKFECEHDYLKALQQGSICELLGK